jgi:hypothetical protein
MQAEQDEAARDELWNTLVNQLRSLLASKESSGELEQTFLDEPLRNELTMTAKSGYLSVWLHTDTGKGSWNVITNKLQIAEPWFMSADGKVELSGENMDIPTLAERFVEKISARPPC